MWLCRALLAACWLWGVDIILWTDVLERPLLEWLMRGAVLLVLATLALDFAARYRVRDLIDSMALIALVGVLLALLFAPSFAFADYPRTLITRALGAFTFFGFEMWALFLLLMGAANAYYQRVFWLVALLLGFFWGIWLRWSPEFAALFAPIAPLTALGLAGALFAGIVLLAGVARRLLRRTSVQALDFRLSLVGSLSMALVIVGLFMVRVLQGALDTSQVFISLLLAGVAWAILWFRRSERRGMLLERILPPPTPSTPALGVGALIFIGSVMFAYHLPLVGAANLNQYWLMEMGFGLAGFAWYPVMAGATALGGVDQQMRRREL